MSDEPVRLTAHDGIAYLTLNAPPRNEMNARFFRALSQICRARLPHLEVRGLIVHGAGRHFSSGADLEELRRIVAKGGSAQFMQENTEAFLAIERLPMPSVAAISGCCLGAGLELALACRYRVAVQRAVLGLPESTFGLMPGCGGTVRLPGLIGRSAAVRVILTGEMLAVEDAAALGIVDAVVERRDTLLAVAEKLVRRLAVLAPSGNRRAIGMPREDTGPP